MRAGLLRNTITIEHKISTRDAYGSTKEVWTGYTSTRAQVTYNSSAVAVEGYQIQANQSINFTIRYNPSIFENMRIVFNGKIYNINSIIINGNKDSITINANLNN